MTALILFALLAGVLADPPPCPPPLQASGPVFPLALQGNFTSSITYGALVVGSHFVEYSLTELAVRRRLCFSSSVVSSTEPDTVYALGLSQNVQYMDTYSVGVDRCLPPPPNQPGLYNGEWFKVQLVLSGSSGAVELKVYSTSAIVTYTSTGVEGSPGFTPPSDALFASLLFDSGGSYLVPSAVRGTGTSLFTCPAGFTLPPSLSGSGTSHAVTAYSAGRPAGQPQPSQTNYILDTGGTGGPGFWSVLNKDASALFSPATSPFTALYGDCITSYGQNASTGGALLNWYYFQYGRALYGCIWASQQPAATASGATPNNATLLFFSTSACSSSLYAQLAASRQTGAAYFYHFWNGPDRPQPQQANPTPPPTPAPPPPPTASLTDPTLLCPPMDPASTALLPQVMGYASGEPRSIPSSGSSSGSSSSSQPTLLSFSGSFGLSWSGQLPERRNASSALCPTSITSSSPSAFTVQLQGTLALSCSMGTVLATQQLCYGLQLPLAPSTTLLYTNASSLSAVGRYSPAGTPLSPPCASVLAEAGAAPLAVKDWTAVASQGSIPPPFCAAAAGSSTPPYLIGYGRNTLAAAPGAMTVLSAWGVVNYSPFPLQRVDRLCLSSSVEAGNYSWDVVVTQLEAPPFCQTIQRWGDTLLLQRYSGVACREGGAFAAVLVDFYSPLNGGAALLPPAAPGTLYSFSASPTPSLSATPSATPTATLSVGASPSVTASPSPSPSPTPSPTASLSTGASPSTSATPSAAASVGPQSAAAAAGSTGAAVGGSIGGLLLLAAVGGAAYVFFKGRPGASIVSGVRGGGGGGGWAFKSWALRTGGSSGRAPLPPDFSAGSSNEVLVTSNPLTEVPVYGGSPSVATVQGASGGSVPGGAGV